MTDHDPHQNGNGKRITGMIEKADGEEAQNERARRAPVPEVLMQYDQSDDSER